MTIWFRKFRFHIDKMIILLTRILICLCLIFSKETKFGHLRCSMLPHFVFMLSLAARYFKRTQLGRKEGGHLNFFETKLRWIFSMTFLWGPWFLLRLRVIFALRISFTFRILYKIRVIVLLGRISVCFDYVSWFLFRCLYCLERIWTWIVRFFWNMITVEITFKILCFFLLFSCAKLF